ncbi:MAG: SirB2 family protein [Pseudomonadota bacterium]
MYAIFKHSHLLIIAIAFVVFFVRGVLMMQSSRATNHKFFKITPHILYTLLLITGIGLAVVQKFSPMQQPWLLAKIIALVVYIILGVLTFKHSNPTMRKILWLLAMIVFVYMVSVALSKNPLGFFASVI